MTPEKQRAAFRESVRAGVADSDAAVERAKSELDALLIEHGAKERFDDCIGQLGMQHTDKAAVRTELDRWLYAMPRVSFAFQRFEMLNTLASEHAFLLDRVESEDAQ